MRIVRKVAIGVEDLKIHYCQGFNTALNYHLKIVPPSLHTVEFNILKSINALPLGLAPRIEINDGKKGTRPICLPSRLLLISQLPKLSHDQEYAPVIQTKRDEKAGTNPHNRFRPSMSHHWGSVGGLPKSDFRG